MPVNLLEHVVEIPPIPRELYRKVTYRDGTTADVVVTANGGFSDFPVMIDGEMYTKDGRHLGGFGDDSMFDIIAIEPITNTGE